MEAEEGNSLSEREEPKTLMLLFRIKIARLAASVVDCVEVEKKEISFGT